MSQSQTPPQVAASTDAPFEHLPVLVEEVLALAPESASLVADVTLGGGGHAAALLERFPGVELFGCDRDPAAVAAARQRLARYILPQGHDTSPRAHSILPPGPDASPQAPRASRVLLKQVVFSQVHAHLLAGSVDFLLADLGVSSPQLDTAGRGFSFSQDGPLDMRMNPESSADSAAQLVNSASEAQLRDWLFRYGEERFAGRIVKAILAARAVAPLESTRQLAELVAGAVPARTHRKGHHPATRTFQALRIAVNDELGQLESLLEHALPLLKPGGRMAVISFHSLEDRMVKTAFVDWEKPCHCPPKLPLCVCGKLPLGKRLTRKPVTTGSEEAARNPRSRSAKLRAFQKQ